MLERYKLPSFAQLGQIKANGCTKVVVGRTFTMQPYLQPYAYLPGCHTRCLADGRHWLAASRSEVACVSTCRVCYLYVGLCCASPTTARILNVE